MFFNFRVAPAVKAVPKSVDSVDSRPKPAPVAAPASAPAKTIKEEVKPVKPLKPANLFTGLQYSKNLVCPNAQVRVQFIYDPLTLHVVADADETPLADMQVELATYATNGKLLTVYG